MNEAAYSRTPHRGRRNTPLFFLGLQLTKPFLKFLDAIGKRVINTSWDFSLGFGLRRKLGCDPVEPRLHPMYRLCQWSRSAVALQVVEVRQGVPEVVSKEIRHCVVRPNDEVQHIRREQRHLLRLSLHDDLSQHGASKILAGLAIANLHRFAAQDHVFDFLQRHVLARISSVVPAVRVTLYLDRITGHSVSSRCVLPEFIVATFSAFAVLNAAAASMFPVLEGKRWLLVEL